VPTLQGSLRTRTERSGSQNGEIGFGGGKLLTR